jgi:polyisoprenoid-binding protein YceI
MEPRKAGTSSPAVWKIDCPYTAVEFSCKRFFFLTVRGRWAVREGTALISKDLSQSSVHAVIDAASINTGNSKRDAHLKSADFFDARNHPEIEFKSTRVERGQDRDTLRIAGTLTIKGVSREIILDVVEAERSRSPLGYDVAYYSASVQLNRADFGIRHGGWLIGPKVNVAIHVQASSRQ